MRSGKWRPTLLHTSTFRGCPRMDPGLFLVTAHPLPVPGPFQKCWVCSPGGHSTPDPESSETFQNPVACSTDPSALCLPPPAERVQSHLTSSELERRGHLRSLEAHGRPGPGKHGVGPGKWWPLAAVTVPRELRGFTKRPWSRIRAGGTFIGGWSRPEAPQRHSGSQRF